ncbi:vitellogenin [Halyomorpha halys]|uniref:vitellogenin n=1 Tax=Halyomorpha halys TaxID=286706 RepID=UPI0006D4E83E|nr:vitellogenin [Halyomorpha halys]
MNWTLAAFLTLVGLATADYGWKPGQQYRYKIEGRTLTGLHQVADQYAGYLIQGILHVYVLSENQLNFQVQDAKYASINQRLHKGWASYIPESQANYKSYPFRNLPFEMHHNNGVFQKMVVDKSISFAELIFQKGIVSQFQVDTQGKNLKESKFNSVPHGEQDSGTFSTMEESIHGKYETNYVVSVLPEYLLQSRPELAPLPHLKGDGEHYMIDKTRNFSNSDEHVVYRYGMNGHEGWDAGTNTMGNILTRTSESKIICSGHHDRYTIQSSVTTEKIFIAPHLYNNQKGIVVSRLNLTLEAVKSKGSSSAVNNPVTVESLVYNHKQGNPHNGNSGESSSSSSSSSESSSQSGSSSSSSSEEEQAAMGIKQSNKRHIRSPSWNNTIILMKQSSDSSSSSSSSSSDSSISSSEEYLETAPDLNGFPYVEFAPDNAASISQRDSQQHDERMIRTARQIGQSLTNPSEMPKEDTLILFEILTRFVGAANTEQLQKATVKLYFSEEKLGDGGKPDTYQNYYAWQAFRDAVARAGHGPALVTIMEWIKAKKVKEYEAAQLFAVIPRSARYPTTEYMNFFFESVKSKEVQRQKYLNDSAILAFTDLIRRSQVDRQSSHHRYPIHLSSQNHNHYAVVEEQYMPWLQHKLDSAILQEDSTNIQLFTRALGNTGHHKVLAIFEPYLEGQRKVTNFQRFLMVAYLNEYAKLHPHTALAVFYRIYQNQGETPEVRAAAVMQLMKTNPPPQILQRMAEQTNYDHSKHVNAAVKSAIESVANGEYSADQEFVKNARAAANFLTTENYGLQYSQNFIKSYIAKEPDTLYYKHDFSSFKGFDGSFPNSFVYNQEYKAGGFYAEPHTVSFLSSSSEDFINLIFNQLQSGNNQKAPPKQGGKSEYSYNKILNSDFLNWEYNKPSQVEANFVFPLFGGVSFYSFDNHSIEQIPEFFKNMDEKMRRGFTYHQSKFYIPYSVEVGFPLVTGDQFTYSYSEPSMAYFYVEGKGHIEQDNQPGQTPFSASTDGQYKAVWAQTKTGKFGFVAPHSEQRYLSVVEKSTQFYAPVKGKFEYYGYNNTFRAFIQPYGFGNHRQKLFQHSTKLYTTYQNFNDYNSYSRGKYVQQVYVRPNKTYHNTFGKDFSGYEFQVEAQSENGFAEIAQVFNAFKRQDYDYFASSFFHEFTHGLSNNYYSISYNPQNSSPQPTEFSLYYNSTVEDSEHRSRDQNVRHIHKRTQSGNMAQPSDEEYRIDELLANAQSGIQDAQASVFDAYVSFAGQQDNGKYYFTTVYADSPVSEKSRFLAFISGRPYQESQNAQSFQAAVHVDFKQPRVPIFNYKQAYEANPTSYFQGKVYFDQNGNSKIQFEGKMQQTEARKQYLKQHPYTYVCEKQMQKGNYILPACHNASQHANVLDKYDVTFKYENLPQPLYKGLYGFYDYIRYWGYQYNQENFVGVKNPQNIFKFSANFSENFNFLNSSFEAPTFSSYFTSIPISHQAQPFLAHSPAYSQMYLFSPHYYYSTPYATCAIDNNEASTFNNRSYPIRLGNCYHVMAISIPYEYQQGSQESSEYYDSNYGYAILTKESGSQKKEVQVLLGDDVVTLEPTGPAGVTVRVNGENIPIADNKISNWENSHYKLYAYALPGKNNAVLYFSNHHFYFNQHAFQLYYDGHRIALMISNSYRDKVRGLCGTFDGEPRNDFTTSANCVVKDYQHFTASYAVADASCKGPSKEYLSQPNNEECYPKEVVYNDVVSDAEARRRVRKLSTPRNNTTRGQPGSKDPSGCTTYQPQVLQDGKNTCFSLQPQATCNKNCQPSRKVEKTIEFHCSSSKDSLSVHWLSLVKKGANPDFSQKTVTKRITVLVPEFCEPEEN